MVKDIIRDIRYFITFELSHINAFGEIEYLSLILGLL